MSVPSRGQGMGFRGREEVGIISILLNYFYTISQSCKLGYRGEGGGLTSVKDN